MIYLVVSSSVHARHVREAAAAATAAAKAEAAVQAEAVRAEAEAKAKAEAAEKAEAAAKAEATAKAEAAAAEQANDTDEGEAAGDKDEGHDSDVAAKSKSAARGGASAADSKRLLEEGNRLLRAERFPEARAVFEKLSKSKRDRGSALVGLAEISFQEKNYAEAVQSASQAVDRGGGVPRGCCSATRISGSPTTRRPPRPTGTR